MSDFSKTEWNILKIVAEQHGKSFQRGAKLASLFEDSFPKHQKEILDNFFYEIDKDSPDNYKFNMSEEQTLYHMMGFIDAIVMLYEEKLIDPEELLDRSNPNMYDSSTTDFKTIVSLAKIYDSILKCNEYFECYEWYDGSHDEDENSNNSQIIYTQFINKAKTGKKTQHTFLC